MVLQSFSFSERQRTSWPAESSNQRDRGRQGGHRAAQDCQTGTLRNRLTDSFSLGNFSSPVNMQQIGQIISLVHCHQAQSMAANIKFNK